MLVKKLLPLSVAGVALLLTACGAKQISVDEAKKFATDNYGTTEALLEGKSTIKVNKATGAFEGIAKDSSEDVSYLDTPIDADYIATVAEAFGDILKIYLDGKCLHFEAFMPLTELAKELSVPETALSGSVKEVEKTDDKGYLVFSEETINISMNFEIPQLTTITGELSVVRTVDLHVNPAN